MILSPISTVLELTVVVVPFTVKSPAIVTVSVLAFPKVTFPFTVKSFVTVRSLPIVTLLGNMSDLCQIL